jgi:hypothetical protein
VDAVPSDEGRYVRRASGDRDLHYAGAFAGHPENAGYAAVADLIVAIPLAVSPSLAAATELVVELRHSAGSATLAVRPVPAVLARPAYLVRDVRGGACVLCHRDLRLDGSIHFP